MVKAGKRSIYMSTWTKIPLNNVTNYLAGEVSTVNKHGHWIDVVLCCAFVCLILLFILYSFFLENFVSFNCPQIIGLQRGTNCQSKSKMFGDGRDTEGLHRRSAREELIVKCIAKIIFVFSIPTKILATR